MLNKCFLGSYLAQKHTTTTKNLQGKMVDVCTLAKWLFIGLIGVISSCDYEEQLHCCHPFTF